MVMQLVKASPDSAETTASISVFFFSNTQESYVLLYYNKSYTDRDDDSSLKRLNNHLRSGSAMR